VVQINIPADDIKRYPELGEKRVGFGLSNILVETLFDTGRFTFLEDKEHILRRLVELWELTEDGILVKNPVAPDTGRAHRSHEQAAHLHHQRGSAGTNRQRSQRRVYSRLYRSAFVRG
jgi:hypothetical protein